MNIQYVLSLLLLFCLLLLFSRRRKALSPRKHSRLAILAKDTGIATFDTKLKISRFQQSRSLKQDIPKLSTLPRIPVRVKSLTKGIDQSPGSTEELRAKTNSEYLNTLQKKLIIKSIKQQNLREEESLALKALLDSLIIIAKSRRQNLLEDQVVDKSLNKTCLESLRAFQSKIHDQQNFKVAAELLYKLVSEQFVISKAVLSKFVEISLSLSLVEWSAFFINEMVSDGMSVPRTLLDQFIQMNFKHKFRKQMNSTSIQFLPQEKPRKLEVLRQKLQNGQIRLYSDY